MKHILYYSLLLLYLSGCANERHRPEGLPPLVSLELTVIDKDCNPIDDALVRLVSIDTPLPFAIIAKTDRSGKAKIMVNGKFDGVPVGKYRVLISKNTGFDKTQGIPKPQPGTVVDIDAELIRITNAVYSDDKKSPLEIEVAEGKQNTATVQLTLSVSDKVPATPKK